MTNPIRCQSTNHRSRDCYGELWQCERCHKTICCAEGTTDHPELCDDCWCAEYAPGEYSTFANEAGQERPIRLCVVAMETIADEEVPS